MKTECGIISVLYYKCYCSSLLGKFNDTKMYFGMLEEEYKNSPDKSSFQEFFTPEKYQELQLIKKQIEMGKMFEVFKDFEPLETDVDMTETEIEEENIIVKKVAKNQQMLEPFLKEKLRLNSLEHDCGGNGQKKDKCDMVSIGNKETLFPIEFKLKRATHAVVGQIGKYCLHFKLRLIQNTYQRVQGVIIANSYSQYAINELRKRGYICLLHFGDLENLRFSSFD